MLTRRMESASGGLFSVPPRLPLPVMVMVTAMVLAVCLLARPRVALAQAAGVAPESRAAEAAAAPTDKEQMKTLDEEARERFELGRTFYDAGRFQQAAEEFGEAYKLSGRPQLLYNLYVANRDAANWELAIEALKGYLDKVPDAPDRINLRARLESLEAQAALQKEQQARAEEERKRNARPLTRLEKRHSIVPYILTGAGGALLIGSIVTGVMAKSKASDLKHVCADDGKRCPSWEKSAVNTQHTLAVTTDVLWSVGAAAAITGVVLWWTGKLDTEREVPVAFGFTPHGVTSSLTVRY